MRRNHSTSDSSGGPLVNLTPREFGLLMLGGFIGKIGTAAQTDLAGTNAATVAVAFVVFVGLVLMIGAATAGISHLIRTIQ